MRVRSTTAWWERGGAGRWVAAVGVVAACGGTGASHFGDGAEGGTDGDGGSDSGGTGSGDSGHLHLNSDAGKDVAAKDADDDANGCPPAATLVYVTGEGSKLYSFYPPLLTSKTPSSAFTLIGTLTCLEEFGPTHMTVDRQATAWVVSNGDIYTASTTNAACEKAPTWTAHPAQFSDFALSFVGVSGMVDNNLYLLGSTELGLFDTATGTVTSIGKGPVADNYGDMTSDGDGTLFFIHDVLDLVLYDINPATAAVVSSTSIPDAKGGGDEALAFWGGSFYAFENDIIYQYDPKTMTTTNLGTAPLSVTGAGQSTCVPKKPPPPPPPPP